MPRLTSPLAISAATRLALAALSGSACSARSLARRSASSSSSATLPRMPGSWVSSLSISPTSPSSGPCLSTWPAGSPASASMGTMAPSSGVAVSGPTPAVIPSRARALFRYERASSCQLTRLPPRISRTISLQARIASSPLTFAPHCQTRSALRSADTRQSWESRLPVGLPYQPLALGGSGLSESLQRRADAFRPPLLIRYPPDPAPLSQSLGLSFRPRSSPDNTSESEDGQAVAMASVSQPTKSLGP
jgi:hypothetical protein